MSGQLSRRCCQRSACWPGDTKRKRVLNNEEEEKYLSAAHQVGDHIAKACKVALQGIRATQRRRKPIEPRDPYVLHDITITLLDCGLLPEECLRLRRENVIDGIIEIHFGKTTNARRQIPMSERVATILRSRLEKHDSQWVFPAPTKSGHAEPSTIKDHHAKAIKLAEIEPFVLYTLRHTCLTRWASHMGRPDTLAFLAAHSDFSTTKRVCSSPSGHGARGY